MDKELDVLVAAHEANVHRAPEHFVQQWHRAIDKAATLEHGRECQNQQSWHPKSFFWGVAVTAALAVGVGIGYLLSNGDDYEMSPTPILAVTTASQARPVPVAFTRGLQVHLRDSRRQLSGPGAATDDKALVLQIIAQNRMFESAADRNNAPQLARLLRAFEPILLQLAATDIAPEDAEALRAQLAFELNVMLTKLASESSDDSQTT